MNWRQKLGRFLAHEITILVIPHTGLRPTRLRASVAFLSFCFALWTGVTIWAGVIVSQNADYWVTRADNQLMKVKLTGLARDVAHSEDALAMVQSTDREMRRILGLKSPTVSNDSDEGVGGPTFADQNLLRQTLYGSAADVKPRDWHRELEAIRKESYKRLASFQEIAWYVSNQRALYRSTPTSWPTEGSITSPFGYRLDPIQMSDDERNEFHSGIDIANNPDTLIHATADGTVRLAGWSHGYGLIVLIDHGYGFSTLYGHLSKFLVKTGDHISRSQVIAYMGTTGRSTGAHLHYEVWRNGRPVNPMGYLKVHSGDSQSWEE